jgi:alkanesulfonate monooxygenase SsuD/methylene tetrahydromethanopterin reductase-like flavin-dependent oxidoreductase (luciferase family)
VIDGRTGRSIRGGPTARGEPAAVVFGTETTLDARRLFYAGVKGRMRKRGHNPDHLKILPATFVTVGDTVETAQARRAHLDSLVHYDSGIHSLNSMSSRTYRASIPMARFPISETNASKSARQRIIEAALSKNLKIRQLDEKAGSYSGLTS